jgi:hypothetical protein
LTVCDLYVDTTGAALWATPEIAGVLSRSGEPPRTDDDRTQPMTGS